MCYSVDPQSLDGGYGSSQEWPRGCVGIEAWKGPWQTLRGVPSGQGAVGTASALTSNSSVLQSVQLEMCISTLFAIERFKKKRFMSPLHRDSCLSGPGVSVMLLTQQIVVQMFKLIGGAVSKMFPLTSSRLGRGLSCMSF